MVFYLISGDSTSNSSEGFDIVLVFIVGGIMFILITGVTVSVVILILKGNKSTQ